MTDGARHDSVEEELAAGTSTPTGRILIVVVALVAAVSLPVAIVVDHSRSRPPAGRASSSLSSTGGLPAAATLLPGLSTDNRLGPDLVYTAVLDNTTDADLTVDYPIRLPGARSSSATVSYIDLTATGELINFDAPPRRMTHIGAHGRITLQVGLHLRCRSVPLRRAWPTGSSRIAIKLDGYPTPAVFSFASVFGFNIRADVRGACHAAARVGDR